MTSTQFMFAFSAVAAPWLVALMRRHSWSDDLVMAAALLVSVACYLLGQAFDGVLTWPLPPDFWTGLAAAFGLNQAGYYVTKRVAPLSLEKVEKL